MNDIREEFEDELDIKEEFIENLTEEKNELLEKIEELEFKI